MKDIAAIRIMLTRIARISFRESRVLVADSPEPSKACSNALLFCKSFQFASK